MDGEELVVCPGRDHRVSRGDSVTVLGTADELLAAELLAAPEKPSVGARFSTSSGETAGRLRHFVTWVVSSVDRRIGWVLAALFGLVVGSTAILHHGYHEPASAGGEGMTVLDALYFTVETIGTVGYGDFYFRDQDDWLRIYAIGLMIVGALTATALFALLTNILVSRRIEESIGRLRVTRLADHVVVVGLGAIGIRVVELLVRQGSQVVVIEPDENNRYLVHAKSLGVPVVAGDATQPDVLSSVHVSHARAVAVLTSDDLVNIETGLAVRSVLSSLETPLVLRLFDRRLARTLQQQFGFGAVRSTAALAAPWFVGAALGLEVLGTFYVADIPMLVASLPVAAGSSLVGVSMEELSGRTRVVALSRASGDFEYPPRRDTRFAAGDTAYLVGPYEELLHLLR